MKDVRDDRRTPDDRDDDRGGPVENGDGHRASEYPTRNSAPPGDFLMIFPQPRPIPLKMSLILPNSQTTFGTQMVTIKGFWVTKDA